MKRKLLFIHSLGPHSHLSAEVQDHLRHSKRKILFPDVTETTENNYSLSLHREKVPSKPGHSSVPVYCVMTNGQEGKNSQTGFTTANPGAYSLSQRWAPLRCINTKQLTHYSTPLPAQPASQSVVLVTSPDRGDMSYLSFTRLLRLLFHPGIRYATERRNHFL